MTACPSGLSLRLQENGSRAQYNQFGTEVCGCKGSMRVSRTPLLVGSPLLISHYPSCDIVMDKGILQISLAITLSLKVGIIQEGLV